MKKIMLAISLFVLGWTAPLSAEVMTYQGRLKESNIPVNASRNFLFELCATETPTGCVASPDGARPFQVQNGLFKSTFTLPAVDLSAGPWYLRVNVEGNYLSPVEKLTFVPYSLYASTAAYSPAALQKAGDTMTGPLTLFGSTLTVTGSAFSVGGSTLVVVNGKVGIGTANPQAKLDVDGGHAIFENDGSDINLYLKTKTAGAYLGNLFFLNYAGTGYGGVSGDQTNGRVNIWTGTVPGGNEKVTISSNGNVGIGTTSPAYRLVVSSGAGEAGTIMAVSTGTTNIFSVDGYGVNALKFTGDGSGLTGVTGASGTDSSKLPLTGGTMTGGLTLSGSTLTVTGAAFSVGGSTLVVANGNVGIGTANPAAGYELHVLGQATDNGDVRIESGSGTSLALSALNAGYVNIQTALGVSNGGGLVLQAAAGNVGIGMVSPGAMLDVAGSGNFSGSVTASSGTFKATGPGQFSVETSSGILVQAGRIQAPAIQLTSGAAANFVLASDAAGNAKWVDPAAGGVGDGLVGNEVTDAANTSLTRSGAGTAMDPYKLALNLSNANNWTAAQTFNAGLTGSLSGSASQNILKAGDTMSGQLTNTSSITITGNGGAYGLEVSSNVSLAGTIYSANGNVGIGTATPGAKLDIQQMSALGDMGILLRDNAAPLTRYTSIWSGTNGSVIDAKGALAGWGIHFSVNGFEKARITDTGKVGIGTTAPDQKLTVAGDISQTGVLISSGTGNNYFAGSVGIATTSPAGLFQVGGGSLTVLANGNIGIGTTMPAAALHLFSTSLSKSWITLETNAAPAGNTTFGVGIAFKRSAAAGSIALVEEPDYSDSVSFALGQWPWTRLVNIQQNGNIGIGTVYPGAKLDVAGIIRSTNSIYPGDGSAFQSSRGLSDDPAKFRTEFSSNVYMVGYSSAARYYGDGSALTGVSGTDATKLPLGGGTLTGQLTSISSVTITGNGGIYGLQVSSNVSLAGALYSANGNVGIGTASPQKKLYVVADLPDGIALGNPNNIDAIALKYDQTNKVGRVQSYATGNGSTLLLNPEGGSVGVGTTAPSYRLHVSSGAGESGTILAVSTGATNIFTVDGSGVNAIRFTGDGSGLTNLPAPGGFVSKAGDTMIGQLTNTSSVTITGNGGVYGLQVSSNVSLAGALYSANGNVGVGTAIPTGKLDVRGSDASFITALYTKNDWAGGGVFQVNNFAGTLSNAIAGDALLTNTVGHLLISPNAAAKDLKLIGGSWTNPVSMIIKDGGYVGIGTASPQKGLHVMTNAIIESTSPGLYDDGLVITRPPGATPPGTAGYGGVAWRTGDYSGISGDSTLWLGLRNASNNWFLIGPTINNTGTSIAASRPEAVFELKRDDSNKFEFYVPVNFGRNVGVGTSAPQSHLQVGDTLDATAAGAANLAFLVHHNALTAGGGPGIGFSSDNTPAVGAKIVHIRTGSNSQGDLAFYTKTNNAVPESEKMRIKDSGNVGLSTGAPQARLDVLAAGSAQTDMAQLWRNSAGTIVSSVSATGVLMAGKFIGDGSGLSGISGNDATKLPLAGGTMAGDITMGGNDLYAVSTITATGDITAARYQIAGSTVLAILPGTGSLGVGVNAGRVNTGDYNSFLGYNAGYSNATGVYQSFLGYNAGYSNTTGGYNSFLGSNAGYYNTIGRWNSFLGYGSGYNNTTGDSNSFLGYNAGYNNTTGGYNSFLGFFAGYYTKAGSANAVFGTEAGFGILNNSFSSSTIMGYRAGYGLTTGSDNILLGFQAGYYVTTGTGNIVIGYGKDTSAATANNELNIGGVLYGDLSAKTIGISTRVPQAALDIVSTGSAVNQYAQIWRDSTGLVVASMTATGRLSGDGSGLTGVSASDASKLPLAGGTMAGDITMGANDLYAVSTITATGDITAARYQIAGSTVLAVLPGSSLGVGVSAGRLNVGSSNSFLGYSAGYSNTTGSNNSFLGYQAGAGNTTGGSNSFLGSYAGFNTTGGNNVFLGAFTGYNNTTGAGNTFVGGQAAYLNSTGGNNTFVGADAAYNSQTGFANAILGREAGYGQINQSFSSSTLVGYRAGYGLSTGGYNILLGFQAGYNVTTGTGNIVIGYGKDTSAATANNELNIGGVLYGDLSAKTIGISTRVPQAALDIVSTGSAVNQYAQIWRDSTGLVVASMTATGRLSGDGSGLTGVSATDATKLPLGGGTLIGQLTISGSSLTVAGAVTAPSYMIGGYKVVAILPGIESLGIGVNAGRINTGDYNVFVGSAAGYNNTTGGSNSFIGYNAGYNNTTGGFNSFIGNSAGYYNTGGFNSFIGNSAGYYNTIGGYNSFMGSSAGYNNTTGGSNSFIGYNAGFANNTGENNSYVGVWAGYYNTTGSANAIFGKEAGYGSFSNPFSSSTLMGYRAGYSLSNGSAGNIFVGFQAGYNVTTGTGNIVIGYGKDTTAPGANNQLNIGGVLYGDLAAGNVGIGTANPTAKLHVDGDVLISTTSPTGGAHLRSSQPTAPGAIAGATCGTGPSASISGTDMAGSIGLNTGITPGAGCTVTVNFVKSYAIAPKAVVITPMGSNAHLLNASVNPVPTIGGFTIQANNAVAASTLYSWSYIVIE